MESAHTTDAFEYARKGRWVVVVWKILFQRRSFSVAFHLVFSVYALQPVKEHYTHTISTRDFTNYYIFTHGIP